MIFLVQAQHCVYGTSYSHSELAPLYCVAVLYTAMSANSLSLVTIRLLQGSRACNYRGQLNLAFKEDYWLTAKCACPSDVVLPCMNCTLRPQLSVALQIR
jgi:hypothetical protein